MKPFKFRGITLPADLRETIDAYVQHGRPTGDFLRSIIENDLKHAVLRADAVNSALIEVIVGYFYNEAPHDCWGFKGAYSAWITHRRIQASPPKEESRVQGS